MEGVSFWQLCGLGLRLHTTWGVGGSEKARGLGSELISPYGVSGGAVGGNPFHHSPHTHTAV